MFHDHLDYFKNHLLEVGLTQNQATKALQNLTTVDLLHFITCEDPSWIEIHWITLILKSKLVTHYINFHTQCHANKTKNIQTLTYVS